MRDVKAGRDPAGLHRHGNGLIPTYCNNTVMLMPPAASEAADKKAMRAAGLRLAKTYLDQPPLMEAAE
jgi:hypothetical protein